MKDSDELIISTNIIFTVVTTTFVAVVVVMVTRPRSDVCCLPGSCDVSAASATLGNTLLRYAHPPWNRLAGQTLDNSRDSGENGDDDFIVTITISTRMGDRLWTDKPSRYVTSQLGRLSLLPSVGR